MKLAFSTLGCPSWTWNQILQNAVKYGFTGIEVRGIGEELRSEKLAPFLPENAGRTKAELSDRGLVLCGLGTSVTLHDRDRRPEMLEEGKTAIEVCARMGIPGIRVFGDQLDPADPEATLDFTAQGARQLCRWGSDLGVSVLLEVHGTFNTIQALEGMIQRVDSPNFGLIWDIQHSDRVYGDDFLPFYQALAPWIRHVHVKEAKRGPGGQECALMGQGDIPIPAILKALREGGYDGFYSFEWEKRWEPSLAEPEEAFPAYVRWMKRQEEGTAS